MCRNNGTRWVQYKDRATKALIKSNPVIVAHIEDQIAAADVLNAEKAKLKGYLTKLRSLDFIMYLFLLRSLISPLAKLSIALQKYITQFNITLTYLNTFYPRIQNIVSALTAGDESGDGQPDDGVPGDHDDDEVQEVDDKLPAKRPALT